MDETRLADWANFFVAEAGAAAALAGLLFVAISINLSRILAFPLLPGRAAEALVVVLSVLVVSTCGLVPHQGARAFGAELLATGLAVAAAATILQYRARTNPRPESRLLWRVGTAQLPAAVFAGGGALLLAGEPSGIDWVMPATILSFAGGVFNAWVLLVEIQR